MGLFKTEKLGEFSLTFPEYSASKRIDLRPDIVEYDPEEYQPKFDLIIGTATMKELGIVLDFKEQWITIDEIKLPMRNLKDLQDPNIVHFIAKNEPCSTMEMTKRMIKYWTQNTRKQISQRLCQRHVITCPIPIRSATDVTSMIRRTFQRYPRQLGHRACAF